MAACDYTTIRLCVRAGDRNRTRLQILEDGDPKNLAGATVTAEARAVSTDAVIALTATVAAVDDTRGIFDVSWDGDAVRTLLAGEESWTGVWDLNVVESGETLADTPCGGPIEAVMDVTRG